MRIRSSRAAVASDHASWLHSLAWSGIVACLIAVGVAGPTSAAAGTLSRMRMPQGSLPPACGLQMWIDFSGVESNGYRPVHFSLQALPLVPSAANRTLKLELNIASGHSPQRSQTVVGYATLPAGATSVEAELLVPLFFQPRLWTLRTSEDGQVLKELSTLDWAAWNSNGGASEAIPAILIIDADALSSAQLSSMTTAQIYATPASPQPLLPDLRHLPNILTANPNSGAGINYGSTTNTDTLTLQLISTLPSVQLLPLTDLPRRWLDLTCFDMIFISAADLQTLVTQHPEAWQAIRDWLATGPTLCVYDMDLSVAELQKLESILKLASESPVAPETSDHPGWRAPATEDGYFDTITALASRNQNYGNPYLAVQDTSESGEPLVAEPEVEPQPITPKRPPFLFRDVDLGRVVATENTEPFLRTRGGLPQILNELPSGTWMWYRRHGVSTNRDNNGFWNWMVRGVGAAPVGTFLLLITLFVVLIGPVNYLLLRRYRRLNLLLVTVPLGAGLVTLVLFAYALIADGLDVRVRVRGIVEMDQPNGRMVSWSRQSYYAGLAPSQGLSFPANAAVYPIYASTDERPQHQHVEWDEDGPDESGTRVYGDQHLVSGYLSSRSLTQYLVVTSGSAQGGLRIKEGAAGANSLRVTNQWPVTLQQVSVWDSQGRCYLGSELAAGGTRDLKPSDTPTALTELNRLGFSNPLQYPPGYDDYSFRSRGGRYYYSGYGDYNMPPPDVGTSILETRFSLGTSYQTGPDLERKRTYIATTTTAPGVPLGLEELREESSVYVIRGRW